MQLISLSSGGDSAVAHLQMQELTRPGVFAAHQSDFTPEISLARALQKMHCPRFIRRLISVYPDAQFFNHGTSLGYISNNDICKLCGLYTKLVAFQVRHSSDKADIHLRFNRLNHRRISGFPNPIDWFIKRQNLNAKFGSPNHESTVTGPRLSDCSCRLQRRRDLRVWEPIVKAVSGISIRAYNDREKLDVVKLFNHFKTREDSEKSKLRGKGEFVTDISDSKWARFCEIYRKFDTTQGALEGAARREILYFLRNPSNRDESLDEMSKLLSASLDYAE
ncbi:hypothetical protein VE04_07698 [Pseudogymnoascus sp. 24MN13]|nr:hypothetical protein VE04_07698 [Pseudogymnoascus sp. 24MN13]